MALLFSDPKHSEQLTTNQMPDPILDLGPRIFALRVLEFMIWALFVVFLNVLLHKEINRWHLSPIGEFISSLLFSLLLSRICISGERWVWEQYASYLRKKYGGLWLEIAVEDMSIRMMHCIELREIPWSHLEELQEILLSRLEEFREIPWSHLEEFFSERIPLPQNIVVVKIIVDAIILDHRTSTPSYQAFDSEHQELFTFYLCSLGPLENLFRSRGVYLYPFTGGSNVVFLHHCLSCHSIGNTSGNPVFWVVT